MERKIFICDCHTVEHQFIIEYFNDGDDDNEVYVGIRLNSFGNVFQRLWRALKYTHHCQQTSLVSLKCCFKASS